MKATSRASSAQCLPHAHAVIRQPAALFLSERTVKGHISAIFLKLGVRDRPAAIIRAYDAGLVP